MLPKKPYTAEEITRHVGQVVLLDKQDVKLTVPGVRFTKAPKLFRLIWGTVIHTVS